MKYSHFEMKEDFPTKPKRLNVLLKVAKDLTENEIRVLIEIKAEYSRARSSYEEDAAAWYAKKRKLCLGTPRNGNCVMISREPCSKTLGYMKSTLRRRMQRSI